ncbi:MAG: hypothetical protein WBN94_03990 [Methanothrix sp.]
MAALVEVVQRQGTEIELLQENQTNLYDLIAKLLPKPTEAQTSAPISDPTMIQASHI